MQDREEHTVSVSGLGDRKWVVKEGTKGERFRGRTPPRGGYWFPLMASQPLSLWLLPRHDVVEVAGLDILLLGR